MLLVLVEEPGVSTVLDEDPWRSMLLVLVEGPGVSTVLDEDPGSSMLLVLVEDPGGSMLLVLVEGPGGSMLLVLVEELGGTVVLVLPERKGVEERLGMMSNSSSLSSAIDGLALFAESSRCTGVTDALPPRMVSIQPGVGPKPCTWL